MLGVLYELHQPLGHPQDNPQSPKQPELALLLTLLVCFSFNDGLRGALFYAALPDSSFGHGTLELAGSLDLRLALFSRVS